MVWRGPATAKEGQAAKTCRKPELLEEHQLKVLQLSKKRTLSPVEPCLLGETVRAASTGAGSCTLAWEDMVRSVAEPGRTPLSGPVHIRTMDVDGLGLHHHSHVFYPVPDCPCVDAHVVASWKLLCLQLSCSNIARTSVPFLCSILPTCFHCSTQPAGNSGATQCSCEDDMFP